ncbi:MAG: hypothetical protein EBR82_06180 [Caulobacteraceae bacterium]|nr:hypothetical protein [Caulobacteraceae bacterium]
MLNIKNQRAHDLARTLSQMTGDSLTDVVIHSLEAEIERRKARPVRSRAELMAFLKAVRQDAPPEFLSDEDPTAWLYDEDGLPA